MSREVDTCTRAGRSTAWLTDLIVTFRARCHYCNRSGSLEIGPDDRPWHIDHMNPISRGGSDDDDNLVLACARCNLTKSARPYALFKSFAQSSYWVPDEEWKVGEWQLDLMIDLINSVENFQNRAGDMSWRIRHEEGVSEYGYPAIFAFIERDTADEGISEDVIKFAQPVGAPSGAHNSSSREYRDLPRLLVEMHNIMPKLIAEIRMLRAG